MATVTNHVELEQPPAPFLNDELYEIVDGQHVEVPPMGAEEGVIGSTLIKHFGQYELSHRTGWAVTEVLFRLCDEPRLARRPDVAFVPFDRWPHPRVPQTESWAVTPALAVEVVSRTNTVDEIQGKIHEYFAYGAIAVWVIHPRQKEVHVYQNPKTIRVLDEHDTLDGGELLPGFQLSVAKLFEGLEKPK